MNLPNTITAFRFVLVPVFLYFALAGEYLTAMVVFLAAGASDALDGFLARRYGLTTDIGRVLDPAADKLLTFAAMVSLTWAGILPIWLSVPVVLRDVSMLAIYLGLRLSGRPVVVVPSVFGKLSTFLVIVTVTYALFYAGDRGVTLFNTLAAFTALVTVYSGIDYAVREFRGSKEARGAGE